MSVHKNKTGPYLLLHTHTYTQSNSKRSKALRFEMIRGKYKENMSQAQARIFFSFLQRTPSAQEITARIGCMALHETRKLQHS